jgi:hypothetical protein
MAGMLPTGTNSWWQPHSVTNFDAFEGRLHGSRGYHGDFFILVDTSTAYPREVYIYCFKT